MVGLRDLGGGTRYMCAPAAGSAYLDGVLASTVFDLDATISGSYPGTGTTWANLIAAPADGSAQAAYDFHTGDGSTTSTYPTFNGTPGDPAAYWGFDGLGYFELKSGANTAFFNALHKTTGGTDWWFAAALSFVEGAGPQGLWGTQAGSTVPGVRCQIANTEKVQVAQRGNSVGGFALPDTLVAAGNNILIVSHSNSLNQTTIWFNGVAEVEAQTFSTATDNATQIMRIGTILGTASRLVDTTRLYNVSGGNEYLDATKAAAIIAHLEARHGRDYTP